MLELQNAASANVSHSSNSLMNYASGPKIDNAPSTVYVLPVT